MGKLRIQKRYLLFFIILVCNEVNGFTVVDTTLLNYYEDFKGDINSSDYEELLSIPYIDSIKARTIIRARKKWGKIIDRRMLTYILGRENADLIDPYIIYDRAKIGLYPKACISTNDDKIDFDFNLFYERNDFKSFLFYDLNDRALKFYSSIKRNGFEFIIGNYTTSVSFLRAKKNPLRIYRYRSEKRSGVAIIKQTNDFSFLLSGKYRKISINDTLFSHLKTEVLCSYKLGHATITAGCYDSLLLRKGRGNNNFIYDFVISGRFNNIYNYARSKIKEDEIETSYRNYYSYKNTEFYNNVRFHFIGMEKQSAELRLNGKFGKDNWVFDYYIKNEYSDDSIHFYYKWRLRKTNIYKNVKFTFGLYPVLRSDYKPSNAIYPNLLMEIDIAEMKTGIFLNIMTSSDSSNGMKGELFCGFVDYVILPNFRITLSSIMFNVDEGYNFENIAYKYIRTGNLYGRGALFKGKLSLRTNVADCDLILYIKKNTAIEEKAELTVSHMF